MSDVQKNSVEAVNPYLRDPIESIAIRSNEQNGVGVILENNKIRHYGDRDSESVIVGRVSPQPIDLEVTSGDKLILLKTANNNHPNANTNEYDHMIKISCTMPEILHKIQQGDRVFIDDGKIEAVVLSSTNKYLVLKIVSPSDSTAKIKKEKGLNFPDSELSLSAITSEDVENLSFIVSNATAVALSFVHSSQDILDLHKALVRIGKPDFGIIAKIETRNGIHNLSKILLSGLDLPKFGVLIARGDLAVEIGFENLSLVQEDILCLCEAAHIPVILATQVLETLAKSGLPTRAEITDAAIGYRAECVMLNKGKHVLEAVRLLSFLLAGEEKHHIKKRQLLRDLTTQYGFSK
ncbi:MAG TPA: pyruvate kinase [Nitrososphaeraceae archaeon]